MPKTNAKTISKKKKAELAKAANDERTQNLELMDNLSRMLEPDNEKAKISMLEDMISHAKNIGGRPTVMTDAVLRKLRLCFLMGCTDAEAAVLSGIGERTLYDYQAANPGFSQEKEELKKYINARARVTIMKNINNPEMARWFMETKNNKEFNRRQITESYGITAELTPEQTERMAQILADYDPNPVINHTNEVAPSG